MLTYYVSKPNLEAKISKFVSTNIFDLDKNVLKDNFTIF